MIRKDLQGVRAIGIHAHMPPIYPSLFSVPVKGDTGPAEIEGRTIVATYDLDQIGIRGLLKRDRIAGGSGRHMRVIEQGLYQLVHIGRAQQGLIALDV